MSAVFVTFHSLKNEAGETSRAANMLCI